MVKATELARLGFEGSVGDWLFDWRERVKMTPRFVTCSPVDVMPLGQGVLENE